MDADGNKLPSPEVSDTEADTNKVNKSDLIIRIRRI
jgi:hypothetical protein